MHMYVFPLLLFSCFFFSLFFFCGVLLLHSSRCPQSNPVLGHPHRASLGNVAEKCIGFYRVRSVTALGGFAPSFLALSWARGRCVPGHTSAVASVVPALVTWIQTALSFRMAWDWQELFQVITGGMNKINKAWFHHFLSKVICNQQCVLHCSTSILKINSFGRRKRLHVSVV